MPNVDSPQLRMELGPHRLVSGVELPRVEIAYEIYGELSAARDNVVLVCHALTGSAHAAGGFWDPRNPGEGWWDPLIGPGAALDTDRYAVICSNILGSCYGTTGPISPDPRTGRRYGRAFPRITVADMVAVQRRLLEGLGVTRLVAVAGGSLGGLQVIEWAAQAPGMVGAIIPIASNLAHSAWNVAFNEVARQAIRLDPNFHAGDYDEHGVSPERGLSLARMIAMISYRSSQSFQERFGRELREEARGPRGKYEVESYLHYQGQKLVERFDANCYLRITEAMDDFDVGEGRRGAAAALKPFRGPALVVGIDSDVLYPTWQQHEQVALLRANGNRVVYDEIQSPHGHDAFLMEWDQLERMVRAFMASLA